MVNFTDLCYLVLEAEKYVTTPRQVLYNRYGKDKAERLIAANQQYTQQTKDSPLSKATTKKYNVPEYSNKRLNQKIPVNIKDFKDPAYSGNTVMTPFTKPKININAQAPTADFIRKELQNKESPSTMYQAADGNYFVDDTLGHEATHTLQKITGGSDNTHINPNDPNKFRNYVLKKHELAPFMSTLKNWYHENTGKILPANMSDRDINDFINFWRSNKSPYSKTTQEAHDAVIDALNTPEGRELFRKTVYKPNQNIKNIA